MSSDGEALVEGRYRVHAHSETEWLATDERDGARVLLRPPDPTHVPGRFLLDARAERTAQLAMRIECAALLRVRSASPVVVYDEPPPAQRPSAPMPVADAIECFLQLCEALAKAHALGWSGLSIDVHDVRVWRDETRPRVTVVLPHLPPRGRFAYTQQPRLGDAPVRADLRTAVALLRDLTCARVPTPVRYFGALQLLEDATPVVPTGDDAIDRLLAAVLAQESSDEVPLDVASLAERVCSRATDRAWPARIATWPRQRDPQFPHDLDRLLELAERERALGGRRDRYVTVPLASLRHQRACVALARGALDEALREVDVALALDPYPRYFVTRGVLREAQGDLAAALSDYQRAIDACRREARAELDAGYAEGLLTAYEAFFERAPFGFEAARALYARGVLRLRDGSHEEAECDLTHALAFARQEAGDSFVGYELPRAFVDLERRVLRALVTAIRACVRATPGATAPWLLVEHLCDLGRVEEARAEADAQVRTARDDRVRARRARRYEALFGLPPA